jgi:hypothetical protein
VAAAEAMNNYFRNKPLLLRERLTNCPAAPDNAWPPKSAPFSFRFCNAGKVAKLIKGLNPTTAVGVDGIPVAVLKLGNEVLAGPISHVLNRSLASGRVPEGFKKGIVKPVWKGSNKSRIDPGSYRPVCVLTAVSKLLEVTVKSDLVAHMDKVSGIPTTQHGFRAKRSCSTALGSAHAGWTKGVKAGKVVGLLGFDLSSAFDTLDPSTLLDKLAAIGITGKCNTWFRSYLVGGSQCVDWDGAVSSFVEMAFVVRQGSILGPVLFVLHTADMAAALGYCFNVTYADDSNIWAVGDDVGSVKARLEELAALFTLWAKMAGTQTGSPSSSTARTSRPSPSSPSSV